MNITLQISTFGLETKEKVQNFEREFIPFVKSNYPNHSVALQYVNGPDIYQSDDPDLQESGKFQALITGIKADVMFYSFSGDIL